MTTYTITVTDARQNAGIAKALDAYNTRPGQAEGNVPLSADDFLTLQCAGMVEQWANQYAPDSIPTGQWLQRWTVEEQAGALTLAAQSDAVKGLWLSLLQHATVELANPDLQAGVPQLCGALEQAGVIGKGEAGSRASVILAY